MNPLRNSEENDNHINGGVIFSFAAGNNEVPAEDALVLQLQLSKSQEKLVEALRGQQDEVRELQRLLAEQQGTLVNQQREILDQQRRMFEHMEQVRDCCG